MLVRGWLGCSVSMGMVIERSKVSGGWLGCRVSTGKVRMSAC